MKKQGTAASMYKADFGIPKNDSKRTNSTPRKKAETRAPIPSIKKSFLGLSIKLFNKIAHFNFSKIQALLI